MIKRSLFKYKENTIDNNQQWYVAQAILHIKDHLFKKAQEQAELKAEYTMISDQAGNYRNNSHKYQKQLMGTLAEIYTQQYIQEILNENYLQSKWIVERYDDVRTDQFKSPKGEYDLRIYAPKENQKSFFIEIRSSITWNRSFIDGLNQFDIIGPYLSQFKSEEKLNDIYIRPLYEYTNYQEKKYEDLKFIDYLNEGLIKLYIVAACSKKRLQSHGYI